MGKGGGKTIKIVASRRHILRLKCTKFEIHNLAQGRRASVVKYLGASMEGPKVPSPGEA